MRGPAALLVHIRDAQPRDVRNYQTKLSTRLLETACGRRVTSTSLSKGLASLTGAYFTSGLGLHDYRHLITYIIKRRIGVKHPHLLEPAMRKKGKRAKQDLSVEDTSCCCGCANPVAMP